MLTTKEAKSVRIITYLGLKGYQPFRLVGNEYYFLSPFRVETKPSFSVCEGGGKDGEDIWQDFGLGGQTGGDIIELVKHLEKCTFREALEKLEPYYHTKKQNQAQQPKIQTSLAPSSIKVKAIQPLQHFVLLKYLKEKRFISKRIAQQYLKLVWYENKVNQNLFAFGWQNENGFYELRGTGKQVFKAVTGKKGLTIIPSTQSKNCFVFEGMLDFLSVLELKKSSSLDGDVVILNSTILKNRFLEFLKEKDYHIIYVFFDNDPSGQEALTYLQEKSQHPNIQQQTFYKGFKDVNEYWQHKNR